MQGITYTLQTTNLSLNADTMIALYDQDQTTVLAENDDSNGELASYLAWNAPASGTYYINVRNWNPGNGGCGMTYDVSLAGRAVTFLPLMRR